jgi:hypothetical protein
MGQVSVEGKVVTDGPISQQVLAQLKSGHLHVRQEARAGRLAWAGRIDLPHRGLKESAIDSVPHTVVQCPHGTDGDLAISDLNSPGWLLERLPISTSRLNAPRSHEDPVVYHYNPDADKAMEPSRMACSHGNLPESRLRNAASLSR